GIEGSTGRFMVQYIAQLDVTARPKPLTTNEPIVAPVIKGEVFGLHQCPKTEVEYEEMKRIPYASVVRSLTYAQIIASLHREFSMTDLGALNYFLGISLTRDSSGLFLSQRKYGMEILERAHMVGCNPSLTPVDTESKLGDGVTPGTFDYGLQLFSSTTDSLITYSDVDCAGCPTTRRSTSGYCVFLGNNLLSWSSKHQLTLSRSSAEAEYRGVANVVAETCWIRNLLRELHTPLSSATIVYCDNVSAVYLSSNPVQHQRTKHIEIDIHFVQDLVATGQVRILHVPSRFQYADIFTKGLPSALFDEFRDSLSVCCTPAPTAREY
nr:ribonuclease H-like domain-containing protein [Tanacetum cinerariifolium]